MNYIVELDGKYLTEDNNGDLALTTIKTKAKLMLREEAVFIQNNLGGNAVRYDS